LAVLTRRWQESHDEAAYAELLQESSAPLDRRARKFRVDEWDAEDMRQETVFRVHQRRDKFDPSRGTMLGLALTIHRRLHIDRLRRKKPTVSLSARTGPDVPDRREEDPAALAERADDAAVLRAALRRLDVRQRRALTLLIFEDRSYKEVCAAMGLPHGSLASLVYNAKQRLRADLRRRYGMR
jgi:RNA polymerase sigma-70 factor (ECF subfamily)